MSPKLSQCEWPPLTEPYASGLRAGVAYILERYPETVGIVASGTIVRGNPSASSDLDLYVIHTASFRQRVHKYFGGVPAEIFVNPAKAVRQYFLEENRSGGPITAHMLATGFMVFQEGSVLEELREEASGWLEQAPRPGDLTFRRYMIATALEDATDVAATDPTTARMILGEVVAYTLRHAYLKAGRNIPRTKEIISRLAELDPGLSHLTQRFYADNAFAEQLLIAQAISDKVLGTQGFFECQTQREMI